MRATPWKTPDTLVILFGLAIVAMIASYWIPAGYFESTPPEGRETAEMNIADFRIQQTPDGDSKYRRVGLFVGEADAGERLIKHFPASAESNVGLLNFAFEGLVSGSKYGAAVGVMAFILIIGGAFGIIQATGAIELGILRVIDLVKGKAHYSIPVLFALFSLGGAIFGMGMEAIAFAVILIPAFIAMGYDSVTAVMTTYVASQIGFATSWMNPFSVAIAQGLAGVPVLSGGGLRMSMWLTFTVFGILYTMRYAKRIKKDPESSIAYLTDAGFRNERDERSSETIHFSKGHLCVIGAFILGIVWVTYGVVRYAYYIPEIATQFFTIGIVCGLIGVAFRLPGMSLNKIAQSFQKGAADLLSAALVVGLAKGIILILGGTNPHTPSLLNTVLHFCGSRLAELPGFIAAWSMYAFQSGFNFFITSGSGQAALTMPLMAPLADLAGLTRQLAVLAFQLGDGLTNLIVPTSAALMGTLAVAKIDWISWVRFQIKFQLCLVAIATGFIAFAYATGF